MKMIWCVAVVATVAMMSVANAGMTLLGKADDEIPPADRYSIFIANTYSENLGNLNLSPTPGAKVDAIAMASAFSGTPITDVTVRELMIQFARFTNASCKDQSKVRMFHFSGHSSSAKSSVDAYAIAAIPMNKEDYSSLVPFSWFLYRMSVSNCQYLVVMDADPPALRMNLPSNVSVIWANGLMGESFESKTEGGYLTRAFLAITKSKRNWTIPELDAALKKEMLKFNISDRQSVIPWVQSGNVKRSFTIPKGNIKGLVPIKMLGVEIVLVKEGTR
jgi:Caspase domain